MSQKNKSVLFSTVLKNWPLLLTLIVLTALWRWDALPVIFRTVIMVPMYLTIAAFAGLVCRSVFFRHTTDKTGDSKQELIDGWEELSKGERVKLVVYQTTLLILAAAIIIAGMVIVFGGFGGAGVAMEALK